MKKKFIELKVRTYLGKDYKRYVDQMNKKDIELDESEQWKTALLEDGEPELPKVHLTRVFVDPTRIVSYVETFSMEAAHESPENPPMDTVEVNLDDGVQILAVCSIKEFNKKLDSFYSDKGV